MNSMNMSTGDGTNDSNKNDNNSHSYSIPNLAQTYNMSQEQYPVIGSVPNISKYPQYNSSSQVQTHSAGSFQLPPYQQQQEVYQQSSYYQTQTNNINSNNGQLSLSSGDGYESNNNNCNRLSVSNTFSPMNSNGNSNNNNTYNQNGQFGQQQSTSDYNYMTPITSTQTATNNNSGSTFNYQLPELMYNQDMSQLGNKANNSQQPLLSQQTQQPTLPLPPQSPSVGFNNMNNSLPSLSSPQNYNSATNKKLQTNSIRTLQNLLDMNNLPPPQNLDPPQPRSFQQGNNIQISNDKDERVQEPDSSIDSKSHLILKPSQGIISSGVNISELVTDGDHSNITSESDSHYSNIFINSTGYPRDKSTDTTVSSEPDHKLVKKRKKASPDKTQSKTKKTKNTKKKDDGQKKKTDKRRKKIKKKKLGPKRPSSAYFLYFIAIRQELIEAHPVAKVPEVAKIASIKWKNMSEEERKPYNDQFKMHWDHYLAARDAYKKSLPPKRPSGPFIRFTQDMRPKLTAENPDKNLIEVTKVIGQKWKELTDEERSVYTTAYKRDLRIWENTVGFKKLHEEGESNTTGEESTFADTDDHHTDDVNHDT